MNKKCIFIDHKYHSTTSSTKFLVELLSTNFEVDILYLEDFSASSFENMKTSEADLYVVFQYDFIASFLLSNNRKVLVVPMYDGTGEMAPIHWLTMQGSLFLNFSEVVHKKITALGLDSIFGRYYPDSTKYPQFSSKNENGDSIFFWERQPVNGLSVDWLSYQLNCQAYSPKKVHIHQSPDPGQYLKRHSVFMSDIFSGREVSTSSWFSNKNDYLEKLANYGIYIAPRKAEGIGFSFIDAMACGLIVFAHDMPTMNEYIQHEKNGILFDVSLPDFRKLDLNQLRNQSRNSFVEGRKKWLLFADQMLSSIQEYVSSENSTNLRPMSSTLASQVANAFFRRQDVYAALIYDQVINLKGNEIWRFRSTPSKWSARLPIKLKKNPVLGQILIALHSKRKKIV